MDLQRPIGISVKIAISSRLSQDVRSFFLISHGKPRRVYGAQAMVWVRAVRKGKEVYCVFLSALN
jgi:hypothetical protein